MRRSQYDPAVPLRSLSLTVLVLAALVAGCGGSDAVEAPSGDVGTTTAGSAAVKVDGEAVFTDAGCASCHTLAAAGSKGISGPNLDELRPSVEAASDQIAGGGGGMPGYSGRLKPEEIQAVAEFVATNAGR